MAYKWKPLQRAYVAGDHPEHVVNLTMETYKVDRAEAIAKLEAYDAQCSYWRNDLYQVQMRGPFPVREFGNAEMVHLNIRRIDGAAIFDWRHRQYIKNELVGPECEAFEVYPAESRLVDTSNKYHLWAFVDPEIRLPVQIGDDNQRLVVEDEVKGPPGIRQRGL